MAGSRVMGGAVVAVLAAAGMLALKLRSAPAPLPALEAAPPGGPSAGEELTPAPTEAPTLPPGVDQRSRPPSRLPARPIPVESIPYFVVVDMDALRARIETPTGAVRVLHLWASWSPESIEELPELAWVQRSYRGRVGVEGLCVEPITAPDTMAQRVKVRQLLARKGAAWTQLWWAGQPRDEVLTWLGITEGLPATFVYGPDAAPWASYRGQVRARQIWETLALHGIEPSSSLPESSLR